MGQPALDIGLSPADYLAIERRSETKHEYADGEMFAMAGGTREHSLLASNITRELSFALLERRCEVYTSDMRVHIPARRHYVYPDVSVSCGHPLFADDERDTLLNPNAIVEVLSDSSESYDRGDKFAQYRTLPSLKEYVLVSQKTVLIEHFRRQTDGDWLYRALGPGERLVLPTLECELAIDRAYLKVFDAPASG
jgi:Uma2 family endonuclease